MSILRVEKDGDYTVIANQPITDSALSWGARGLLVYLLSKPDNWTVRMVDLVKQSPAGEHATRKLVKELETAGYLKRHRYQTEAGKFSWETIVHEAPQTIPQKPTNGLSTYGKPTSGKVPHIVSTELTSTELNNNIIKANQEPTPKTLRQAEEHDLLKVVKTVCHKIYGAPANYADMIDALIYICEKNLQPGDKLAAYLEPFWLEWTGRGYNKSNANWLIEWAQTDNIPTKAKKKQTPKRKQWNDEQPVNFHEVKL